MLALLPVGGVSLIQGYDRVERDMADVHDRLVQMSRAAALDEQNIFASGEQILRAMANQPDVRDVTEDCRKTLVDSLKGLTYFSNLSRSNASGNVMCSAAVQPLPGQENQATRPWWPDEAHRNDFYVTPVFVSARAKRNIIGGVLPLHKANGAFDGVLLIGLDTSRLEALLQSKPQTPDSVVAIFDRTGALVATNNRETAAAVFGSRIMPASASSDLMSGRGPRGNRWSYTITPLLDGGAYVAFGMRTRPLFRSTYLHVATDLLLPVLMLSVASLAIWIATDRLVTRWIVYLKRIATAYGRGHYTIRPLALEEAPGEFRTLGETFSSMAAAVQDRDRRLREALAQKTLLIRETHHRVKNNLQIVMSLLALQAGQLRDPAAQNALRQAQVRVNALALVHRILHEIEDLGSVELKRLIEDLAAQIHEGFGAARRDVKLELELASRQASGDLAVPITLFTVEALTNAFKHAYPVGTRGGVIRVSLLPVADDKLRLVVEDDGMGLDREQSTGGIGSRLIKAFAQQVGGTATISPRQGGGTQVALVFPDPLFGRRDAEPAAASTAQAAE